MLVPVKCKQKISVKNAHGKGKDRIQVESCKPEQNRKRKQVKLNKSRVEWKCDACNAVVQIRRMVECKRNDEL